MRKRKHVIWIALVMLLGAAGGADAEGNRYAPPWSKPMVDGVNFTVPGIDNAPDLHGDVNAPQLVVFFAGNQYMLVNKLMQAFMHKYSQYSHVFAETLPPGYSEPSDREGGACCR